MKKYQFTSDLSKFDKEELVKELSEVIKDGWGDFGLDYVRDHVLTSKYVVLALKNNRIVGFASAREIMYQKEPIYYLEFTAVRRDDQGNKLSKTLNKIIFKQIIVGRLKKLNFSFETLTITPNPRVLGTLARTASFVYPNPYNPGRMDLLDQKIDKLVHSKEVIPEVIPLELEGYVMSGFYEGSPELVYAPDAVPKDRDKIVNLFAHNNLRYEEKKGREFIILARFRLADFLKKI